MIDDINLKDFPRASGVYKIIWNGSVIYIGSSNDLYRRMASHITCIKQGSDHGCKKGFYLFLQNNYFSVEFELTEAYREREQELIDYYEPIYNAFKAFTGCGSQKGRDAEYRKDYYQKFKEEMKQYREVHKEEIKQYKKQYYKTHRDEVKQYDNQKCNYNGEILTLCALKKRFHRQGIPHATLEAKKYLLQ